MNILILLGLAKPRLTRLQTYKLKQEAARVEALREHYRLHGRSRKIPVKVGGHVTSYIYLPC